MSSPPIQRPKQAKYPTPSAYKMDRYYGSSYKDGEGAHQHYLKGRPFYQAHVRGIQRGTHYQGAQIRDLYQGQFQCGGFAENEAAVHPLATMHIDCPEGLPMQPSCDCKNKYM